MSITAQSTANSSLSLLSVNQFWLLLVLCICFGLLTGVWVSTIPPALIRLLGKSSPLSPPLCPYLLHLQVSTPSAWDSACCPSAEEQQPWPGPRWPGSWWTFWRTETRPSWWRPASWRPPVSASPSPPWPPGGGSSGGSTWKYDDDDEVLRNIVFFSLRSLLCLVP